VSHEAEHVHTSDANPYQPMTKVISSRKAEIIGDWWEAQTEEPALVSGAKVVWNPGKKVHEVHLGDAVIYANKDKAQAMKVAQETE